MPRLPIEIMDLPEAVDYVVTAERVVFNRQRTLSAKAAMCPNQSKTRGRAKKASRSITEVWENWEVITMTRGHRIRSFVIRCECGLDLEATNFTEVDRLQHEHQMSHAYKRYQAEERLTDVQQYPFVKDELT